MSAVKPKASGRWSRVRFLVCLSVLYEGKEVEQQETALVRPGLCCLMRASGDQPWYSGLLGSGEAHGSSSSPASGRPGLEEGHSGSACAQGGPTSRSRASASPGRRCAVPGPVPPRHPGLQVGLVPSGSGPPVGLGAAVGRGPCSAHALVGRRRTMGVRSRRGTPPCRRRWRSGAGAREVTSCPHRESSAPTGVVEVPRVPAIPALRRAVRCVRGVGAVDTASLLFCLRGRHPRGGVPGSRLSGGGPALLAELASRTPDDPIRQACHLPRHAGAAARPSGLSAGPVRRVVRRPPAGRRGRPSGLACLEAGLPSPGALGTAGGGRAVCSRHQGEGAEQQQLHHLAIPGSCMAMQRAENDLALFFAGRPPCPCIP